MKSNREVRYAVGVVACGLHFFTVHVKGLIKVVALAFERNPVIESGPGIIVIVAHVPFADESGLIASLLQFLWKGRS